MEMDRPRVVKGGRQYNKDSLEMDRPRFVKGRRQYVKDSLEMDRPGFAKGGRQSSKDSLENGPRRKTKTKMTTGNMEDNYGGRIVEN